MNDRTFITAADEYKKFDGSTGLWYYAFDPVARVRSGLGRFEVNGDGTHAGSHLFFFADDKPYSARQVEIWVHYEPKAQRDYVETMTDYGIELALKGMARMSFTDPYRYLVYLATGMGRTALREDKNSIKNGGRHIVRVRASDLTKHKIDLPAGVRPDAQGFVVLFEEA